MAHLRLQTRLFRPGQPRAAGAASYQWAYLGTGGLILHGDGSSRRVLPEKRQVRAHDCDRYAQYRGNRLRFNSGSEGGAVCSGVSAANTFLAHWDFEEYKALYRSGQPMPSRRELMLPKAVPPSSP